MSKSEPCKDIFNLSKARLRTLGSESVHKQINDVYWACGIIREIKNYINGVSAHRPKYAIFFFITSVYPHMLGTTRSSPGYFIYISTQLYGAKQSMYNLYVNVVQVGTRGIENYDFVNLE